MANVAAEGDFQRAKEIRLLLKAVRTPAAGRAIEAAAARLEARGARKLNKLGRKARKAKADTVRL